MFMDGRVSHTGGSCEVLGCVDEGALDEGAFEDEAPTLLWLFSVGERIISNEEKINK